MKRLVALLLVLVMVLLVVPGLSTDARERTLKLLDMERVERFEEGVLGARG